MLRNSMIAGFCWLSLVAAAQHAPVAENRKLSPLLLLKPEKTSRLHRYILQTSDVNGMRSFVSRAGDSAFVRYGYGDVLSIAAYPKWVETHLLSHPSLLFIDDNERKAKEEVILFGFDYTTNHINTIQHEVPDLNGNNTVVSVKEELPDTADIDFKGRFLSTSLQSPRFSTHATNMSTIIAGGGNSFYTAKGVAWGSRLSSSSFDELLPDSDGDYQRYHITVQNHSYGTGLENYYGAEAAAYDGSVVTTPSLLHVFSSGNSGDQTDSIGPYKGVKGWANLTGNFKMAKNILTVGSIDSFYTVPLLSSKGPAYDGRVKPELVAYGEDGSSGAAALVSGTALLFQDAYQRGHGGVLPPAALVKAFLLNSAEEVGNKGIDFSSGFGSLDAWRAMRELQAGHFLTGSVGQGEEQSFSLPVPAGARGLKVLLCWTDPPALPNATVALVNDLDLSVTESGRVWLPWVLSSAPDGLDRLPVRMRDSLNNEEQVRIDTLDAGGYVVRVRGNRVVQGGQSFFVAYQWDSLASFHWLYPTGGDPLVPGQVNTLRWQTTLTGMASLDYRFIGGEWMHIDNISAAAAPYWKWSPPDTTALLQLRVESGGLFFLSDTIVLGPRLNTGVGFSCPDSVLLYWDKSPAGQYALYRLGERYLEQERLLTDSAVILPVTSGSSYWYAVAPVLAGSRIGEKSYSFDYRQQGVGCYISRFTADGNGFLQLELGSDYQVGSVAIEKASAGGFRSLAVFSPPGGLQYLATDSNLSTGANVYRARVVLQNQRVVYSDLQTVYYTGDQPYFLYPNPVYRSLSLHIVAKGLNNPVFRLYNLAGQVLLEKKLTQLVEDIPISTLSSGLYFYSLEKIRGKLIVL
ncbi:MAG: S8 family peptidase [Bacteroidetes bacterium]|nr:S8 family peptidase [Bacteroidota bacterium]